MMASSVFRGTEARGSVKQSQSRLSHSEILSQKSKTKTKKKKERNSMQGEDKRNFRKPATFGNIHMQTKPINK